MDDLELRQLYLFDVLAQHRHYGRAGVAAGIAQPALSQQILRLERELGFTLLQRTSRSAELTDAGRRLQVVVHRIIAAEADLRSAAIRLTRAMAREVIVGYAGAPPQPFCARIRTGLTAAGWTATFRCLDHGELVSALPQAMVDVLICRGPLPLPDVVVHGPFAEESRSVVMARNHRLSTQPLITVEDVSGEAFVRMPDHVPTSLSSQWALGRDVGLRAGCPEDVLQLVAEGRALAVSPAGAASVYMRDDVIHRSVHGLAPAQLHLAWHIDSEEKQLCTGVRLAADAAEGEATSPPEPGPALDDDAAA